MDRTKAKWIVGAVIAVVGLGAHAIRATESGDRGPLRLDQVSIGGVPTPYEDEALESDFKESLRAREVLYRSYEPEGDAPVWVFLAYFDRQREGSQVHSPRHCYPGSGWSIEEEIEIDATWRDGSVRALVVSDGEVRRLVCYWYQMPGEITPDEFRLKLALTRQAVLRRPQEVVYGNVSTAIGTSQADAYAKLEPYVRAAEQQVAELYQEHNGRQTHTD